MNLHQDPSIHPNSIKESETMNNDNYNNYNNEIDNSYEPNWDELSSKWDELFSKVETETEEERATKMGMVMSMFKDDIAEVSSISTLDLDSMSRKEVAYILERTWETIKRIRMEVDCYLLDAISRKAGREYKELEHE